jgi:hypothetical protein
VCTEKVDRAITPVVYFIISLSCPDGWQVITTAKGGDQCNAHYTSRLWVLFAYNNLQKCAEFYNMQHKGEIVEKAIRQSGISLTALAKKLGKSRRWMYQIFEQPQLSTDVILQIGNIIHYDFTEEIQSLSKYKIIDTAPFQAQEPPAQDYWKDKYLELLEQYKLLLINYNQLLETPASK